MNKANLLLLEDDDDVGPIAAEYLGRHYLVKRVERLAEARAELQGGTVYSVLVADMDLNEGQKRAMNDRNELGLDLVRGLSQMEVRPQVVIFTGFPKHENADRCMRAGAFAYVSKGHKEEYSQLIQACSEAYALWKQTYIPDEPVPKSEAIVVVDLIGSTKSAARNGWEAVGRPRFRALREIVVYTTPRYGLSCQKSTGDGYLLAFRNEESAEFACVQALKAVLAIARKAQEYNKRIKAKQLEMQLRFAIHYGGVDLVKGDREGLTVAQAFRLEALKKSLPGHTTEPFPETDYAILSHEVEEILKDHKIAYPWQRFANIEIPSFAGSKDVFLLRNLADLDPGQ